MIRVVHRLLGRDAPAIGETDALTVVTGLREQPGILQAELYRTMAREDADMAIALIFEKESHLISVLANIAEWPGYKRILETAHTEIYSRAPYVLVDGVWTPEAGADSRLVWPAHGAVSIVIQGAYLPNDDMHELTAEEITDTRREPGCEYYAWMENVELPNHLMLLETWADQRIYDAHWFGRLKTGEYCGDSGRVATSPQRGEAVREFYRQQVFDFHYGRLVPARLENYSESVAWSAR